MQGKVYTEQMCLIQNIHSTEKLTLLSGRLCVTDMPFIHANKGNYINVDGTEVGGVIGLSPARNDHNYVRKLKSEGVIDRAVVGLNYEPWGVKGLTSRIHFGYVDVGEVEYGEAGLNYYSNLGRDKWGLMMDDFYYNGKDMTMGQQPKVALLDTGNITIQLPEFVFDNTLQAMNVHTMEGINFYESHNPDKSITIEADKPCSKIYGVLKTIEFKLQTTRISITPEGYTYEIDPMEPKCQIGLEKLVGVEHEYRLGNVFFRNFYVGLDYDEDMIYVGINKGMAAIASAGISGHVYNPFKPRYTVFKITLILFFVAIIAGGIAYYQHRKKELAEETAEIQQRLAAVHQADVDSDDGQPPAPKANYLIQDTSVEGDLEESLVDNTPEKLD